MIKTTTLKTFVITYLSLPYKIRKNVFHFEYVLSDIGIVFQFVEYNSKNLYARRFIYEKQQICERKYNFLDHLMDL